MTQELLPVIWTALLGFGKAVSLINIWMIQILAKTVPIQSVELVYKINV